MLKKAGFVTAATAALLMVGGTAFAAPGEPPAHTPDKDITYADAYHTFITGGGALGYGAASLIAGAYTGIIMTPEQVFGD